MREIKFRAWDIRNRKIVYNVGIYFEDGTNNRVIGPDSSIIYNAEVMQFTGLKDSNGKEIWEGDKYKWRKETGTIVFEEGCFMCKPDKFPEEHLYELYSMQNDIEVIGNVYENPELLSTASVPPENEVSKC